MTEMKLLADENVRRTVVTILKNLDVDVVHILGIGRRGMPDEELIKYARKEERVIVTHDKDFLVLAGEQEHTGIIFITKLLSAKREAKEIVTVIDFYKAKEMKNVIVYIPQ